MKTPIEDLIDGRYYQFMGIDLISGVWCSARQVFLGLREKWGRLDLSYEDYEATRRVKDSGIDLPEDIECKELLGNFDSISGREIEHDETIPNTELYHWLTQQESR